MRQSKRLTILPKWVVYLIAIVPAGYYFERAVSNNLGADPLAVLENALGEWALILLIIGLTITPVMKTIRINLIKYRRPIGLAAFTFVVLHLTVYLILDRQLNWSEIWIDIVKRPYITIGLSAFLLMIPLAVTSNNISIRKLSSETWRKLHRLVYVIAFLGALHYLLLVKAWPLEPIIYLSMVIFLLSIRIFWLRRRVKASRS